MSKILDKAKDLKNKGKEVHQGATERLSEAKDKVDHRTKVTELVHKFFKDFKTLDKKERVKRIGEIVFVATLGKYLSKLKALKKAKKKPAKGGQQSAASEDNEDFETLEEEVKRGRKSSKAIDPCLVGETPEGMEAVCRRIAGIEEVAEDHRHNARMLEISPGKQVRLSEIVHFYKTHQERYDKVGKATGIPGVLICAIHYREGMDFDRYLHNGQKLGATTTIVPKGILFKKGQWEEAAIHALGGNVKDANGRKSLKKFQNLRKKLGLTADSRDIGAMMAFSEAYNGMGYRRRGIRSCYVYAGTNLQERGHYYADGKFGKNLVDRRLGTAAIIMGIQAAESGETLRVASKDHLKTGKRTKAAPVRPLTAEAKNKFKKGPLLASIAEVFPHAEIQSGLIDLKEATAISGPRKGAPGWKKGSTHEWDYEAAGNNDANIEQGLYRIQAIDATKVPGGYTRSGTDKVDPKIAGKLTQIAVALRADERMPLFTGIAMSVDGVEVMMIKEIHMHARGTASSYLCQPHTGISYIMKKKQSTPKKKQSDTLIA